MIFSPFNIVFILKGQCIFYTIDFPRIGWFVNKTHINFGFFLLIFPLFSISLQCSSSSEVKLPVVIAGLVFYRIVLAGQRRRSLAASLSCLVFLWSQPTSHVQRPNYYAFVQKTLLIHVPQRTMKSLLFLCCDSLTVDEVCEWLFL